MNRCPFNVAWLRLQAGTLRVELEDCRVFSLTRSGWQPLVFTETKDRQWNGVACSGGYFATKLRMTIDGVRYRQRAYLHRVIWMAKHWQELLPTDHVDHGREGRPCNHWTNLEKVTPSENMQRRSDAARMARPRDFNAFDLSA